MKQNKTLLGLGVVVTIVVGMITIGSKVRLNKQNGNKQNNAPTIVTMRKVQPKEEKKEGQYTFEDVALHSKPEDCWFVVNGKVYDVTNYIKMNKHPGGKIIIEGCGKDATELFNTKGGRGEGHSEKAWNFLENYYIGVLDKSE